MQLQHVVLDFKVKVIIIKIFYKQLLNYNFNIMNNIKKKKKKKENFY